MGNAATTGPSLARRASVPRWNILFRSSHNTMTLPRFCRSIGCENATSLGLFTHGTHTILGIKSNDFAIKPSVMPIVAMVKSQGAAFRKACPD